MLERSSHTEVMRPGTPVARGTVVLLPIERVVLHAARGNTRLWFSAVKEPYALIVRDARGIWAIDSDAAALSLERLCETVPGLDSVLAAI